MSGRAKTTLSSEKQSRPLCRRLPGLTFSLTFALSCLCVFGCRGDDEAPASARDLSERLGVETHVGEATAKRITTAVPRAGVQAELGLLRAVLMTHQRTHGSFPASLADVDPSFRLTFEAEYEYDAGTGQVKSRSFPEL